MSQTSEGASEFEHSPSLHQTHSDPKSTKVHQKTPIFTLKSLQRHRQKSQNYT